jgi:hypothetical protein
MAATALATISGSVLAGTGPAAAATGQPAPRTATSLAFTHNRHDITLVAAGVIVLLIIVFLLRVTRRRRETAVTTIAEPQHTFPHSADTWHGADLTRVSNAALPSFRRTQVVLPTVAPGWHPVQGDQTKLAYWDGTRWTAYRQWDGQQWVDAASVQ